MDVTTAIPEQRASTDRRRFSWRTVTYGFTVSRRHTNRRSADAEVIFLDWHHPWLFFLATGTMLLSCADAFLTLLLLEHGMIEVNPVMGSIMEYGTSVFISTKLAMTAIGIFVLVFLAKSCFLNRVRTGLFLTVLFTCYAGLVCYEIVSLLHQM